MLKASVLLAGAPHLEVGLLRRAESDVKARAGQRVERHAELRLAALADEPHTARVHICMRSV